MGAAYGRPHFYAIFSIFWGKNRSKLPSHEVFVIKL